MKKLMAFLPFVLAGTLILSGCNLKKNDVENVKECSDRFVGSWKNVREINTDVSLGDSDEDAEIFGFVTFIVEQECVYTEDLNYKLKLVQKYKGFEKIRDDFPYSEEDLKNSIERSIEVGGIFCADEKRIKLEAQTVTTESGEVSFDDYVQNVENLGDAKMIAEYSFQDVNKLCIGPETNCLIYSRIK